MDAKGGSRILLHLAVLEDRQRPSARERLAEALGEELAERLLKALCQRGTFCSP